MELKLTRQTIIKEVKKQFANYFPFLKIDFFFIKHENQEASSLQQKIPDDISLAEIKTVRKEGDFSFTLKTTVAEFEQRLQQDFGLPVQVFRKSGQVWLETTRTDKLSLDEQNAMAEAASRPYRFNINSLLL